MVAEKRDRKPLDASKITDVTARGEIEPTYSEHQMQLLANFVIPQLTKERVYLELKQKYVERYIPDLVDLSDEQLLQLARDFVKAMRDKGYTASAEALHPYDGGGYALVVEQQTS